MLGISNFFTLPNIKCAKLSDIYTVFRLCPIKLNLFQTLIVKHRKGAASSWKFLVSRGSTYCTFGLNTLYNQHRILLTPRRMVQRRKHVFIRYDISFALIFIKFYPRICFIFILADGVFILWNSVHAYTKVFLNVVLFLRIRICYRSKFLLRELEMLGPGKIYHNDWTCTNRHRKMTFFMQENHGTKTYFSIKYPFGQFRAETSHSKKCLIRVLNDKIKRNYFLYCTANWW